MQIFRLNESSKRGKGCWSRWLVAFQKTSKSFVGLGCCWRDQALCRVSKNISMAKLFFIQFPGSFASKEFQTGSIFSEPENFAARCLNPVRQFHRVHRKNWVRLGLLLF